VNCKEKIGKVGENGGQERRKKRNKIRIKG
jgi:hypothetical protein